MEDAYERSDHAPISANAKIYIACIMLHMSHSPSDWLMRTRWGDRAQKSRIRWSISSIGKYFIGEATHICSEMGLRTSLLSMYF